jgi:Tfp pilus assembly protein PilV
MHANRQSQGFTLIELVIIMVMISAGVIGMSSMFSVSSTSLTTNEVRQQMTQYAQECAERVLATRRSSGFASISISTTMCNTPAMPAMDTGFTRTVTIGSSYDNGTAVRCPLGTTTAINCKDLTITVSHSGLSDTVITVMLVDY